MNILNPSDWNTEFYYSKMTSWAKLKIYPSIETSMTRFVTKEHV
ncbi:MAG: hypothetical protein JG782_108 [Anaerophaga sp.]|nr:hypothetical protein [Anaerophaga sp.]